MKEMAPMPDTCGHLDCSFENRLEYCEIEAGDPEGVARAVVDMLDALLYDSGQVTSEEYTMVAERDAHTLTRNFSYLQGDPKSWVWPLVDTQLAIRHTKDKQLDRDLYEIALSWHVEQEGATEDRFVVGYGIDVYKEGSVQAFIEQPTVVDESREVRRMNTYDYETLFTELSIIYDLHTAERNDNARVV